MQGEILAVFQPDDAGVSGRVVDGADVTDIAPDMGALLEGQPRSLPFVVVVDEQQATDEHRLALAVNRTDDRLVKHKPFIIADDVKNFPAHRTLHDVDGVAVQKFVILLERRLKVDFPCGLLRNVNQKCLNHF